MQLFKPCKPWSVTPSGSIVFHHNVVTPATLAVVDTIALGFLSSYKLHLPPFVCVLRCVGFRPYSGERTSCNSDLGWVACVGVAWMYHQRPLGGTTHQNKPAYVCCVCRYYLLHSVPSDPYHELSGGGRVRGGMLPTLFFSDSFFYLIIGDRPPHPTPRNSLDPAPDLAHWGLRTPKCALRSRGFPSFAVTVVMLLVSLFDPISALGVWWPGFTQPDCHRPHPLPFQSPKILFAVADSPLPFDLGFRLHCPTLVCVGNDASLGEIGTNKTAMHGTAPRLAPCPASGAWPSMCKNPHQLSCQLLLEHHPRPGCVFYHNRTPTGVKKYGGTTKMSPTPSAGGHPDPRRHHTPNRACFAEEVGVGRARLLLSKLHTPSPMTVA